MLRKYLESPSMPLSLDLAILILRVGVSVLMLTHGWPKFEKILAGDITFGDPIGLGESLSLYLTVFAEVLCSILLILGLFSRPALLFLAFTMLVAAFIVHGSDGIGKMEKALLYLLSYICLFLTGPGRISLDAFLLKKWLR